MVMVAAAPYAAAAGEPPEQSGKSNFVRDSIFHALEQKFDHNKNSAVCQWNDLSSNCLVDREMTG